MKSLQAASEMLSDARLMYENTRLKSAADRAYYAMFHAAQAALAAEVERLPKSHSGTRTLFAQHLIATNRLDRSLSRDLTYAFELRQSSAYEVEATFGLEAVEEIIARAERFVQVIRVFLQADAP